MSVKNFQFLCCVAAFVLSAPGCDVWSDADAEASINEIYESNILDPENLPDSQNKCGGEKDKIHMRGDNLEFARNVEKCVHISGFSAYLDKREMKGIYPDMSDGCIDCFAQMTDCAAGNCVSSCGPPPFIGYGSDSRQCLECQILSCHASMWVCSGVQSRDIPRLHQK